MPRLIRTALRYIPPPTSASASASASASRNVLIPLPRSSILSTSIPSTSASLARPTLTTIYRSIRSPLSLLSASSSSILSNISSIPRLGGIRYITMGTFYQPSQRKRKRKHGFLVRLRKGANSRKMLYRRIMKGRKNLSH